MPADDMGDFFWCFFRISSMHGKHPGMKRTGYHSHLRCQTGASGFIPMDVTVRLPSGAYSAGTSIPITYS